MAAITEPLTIARRRLEDAVHAMCDPRPLRVGDGYRWRPALYLELRSGLTGQSARRRTLQQRSRPPLRVEVLDLVVEIDRAVSSWTPDEKGSTVERLRSVAARAWRPQDVPLLERYREELLRWTVAATELLTPTPRVGLPMPCPRCGARRTYRRNGAGESVQSRALEVAESGCRCLACRAFWPPSEFHWLARLLGCDPVAAS